MSDFDTAETPVQPARSTLITLVAVLNVVSGLVCGCTWGCMGFSVLMTPSSMRQGAQQAAVMRFERIERMQTQIAQLDEEISKASTDAGPGETSEKQQLQTQRTALATALDQLQKRPDPTRAMNAAVDVMTAPGTVGFVIGCGVTAFLWNAGLIGFAFGLFGRRQWGRRGLTGLAAVKIAIEVALAAWVVLSVPALTELAIQRASEIPGTDLSEIDAVRAEARRQALLWGMSGSVLGAVYPAVLLVVLNLRRVRNEFMEWSAFRAGADQ